MNPNDTYGIIDLTFFDGNLLIENKQDMSLMFQDTNASICDDQGNLLFYFNGADIENYAHDTIENGYHLNNGDDGGLDLPQGD